MRLTMLSILALGTALTSACAGSGADASGHTERDSAGIRVVDNARPSWRAGEGWRLDSARMSVGAAEGGPGHQLHVVSGAVRLGDGTLVIANGGSRELLRYDGEGRFLGASGGEGDGPGEFRALDWIGRTMGDSIITWDRGLNRLTIHTSGGVYARDYKPVLSENPMSLRVRGSLSGNRLLMARGASFIPADGVVGVQRQPITAWVIDSTGREIGSIGPFAGEAVNLAPGRTPNSTIRTPIPLGASTQFATGRDVVYVVDTDLFAVRSYGVDGRLRSIIRRPHTPIPVQPEDVGAVIEAAVENAPPVPEIREGIRAAYGRVPPPQHIPAIRAVLVDSEDNIWVAEGAKPGASDARWTIFAPNGRWLGDIVLPSSLQILEIGSDYLIARDRDEVDVERVRVLGLRR